MEYRTLPWRDVLSAGLGAAITDTLFNPLAVITVRLQVDREQRLYRGLQQCAARIVAEDSLVKLWTPGLVATWMRAFSQSGLRLGLYPSVKRLYLGTGTGDGLAVKIASGATTGALGSAIANPIELARVKLQSEAGSIVGGVYTTGLRCGHAPSHPHTAGVFIDTFRQEGIRGMWRGVSANMCRASLLSAGQLATYDQSKQLAIAGGWTDGPQMHLACSCLSGFVAQAACMPADVVKTRVQSGQHAQLYRSPAHCLVRILRDEGFLVLYRGFTAAAARQVPVMAVQMPIVEQIRKRCFSLEYL